MIALKRILVPVDFSETSEAALRYAKEFAQAFGASLHVLHVLVEWMPDGYIAFTPDMYHSIENAVTQQLQSVLTEDEKQKFNAQVRLERGTSEFVEIIRYAREHEIDLIILGTHGRGAIAHMLLGSVAEKVVRKAPCPVLTVRHPEHEFVMP
jgi:nucleotide-binding universal stress UspA family protein